MVPTEVLEFTAKNYVMALIILVSVATIILTIRNIKNKKFRSVYSIGGFLIIANQLIFSIHRIFFSQLLYIPPVDINIWASTIQLQVAVVLLFFAIMRRDVK